MALLRERCPCLWWFDRNFNVHEIVQFISFSYALVSLFLSKLKRWAKKKKFKFKVKSKKSQLTRSEFGNSGNQAQLLEQSPLQIDYRSSARTIWPDSSPVVSHGTFPLWRACSFWWEGSDSAVRCNLVPRVLFPGFGGGEAHLQSQEKTPRKNSFFSHHFLRSALRVMRRTEDDSATWPHFLVWLRLRFSQENKIWNVIQCVRTKFNKEGRGRIIKVIGGFLVRV